MAIVRFVGVDPGKDGAFVGFNADGGIETMTLMPTLHQANKGKRLYDVPELVALVEHLSRNPNEPPLWIIEKQQPFPKFMGGSSANFGRGYGIGIVEGIVATLRMPYLLVAPGTWQKAMLRDIQGKDTKVRALQAACRLFPRVDWRKSALAKMPHDGLVDAALIG